MKLIIAEKYSVVREIARVIGGAHTSKIGNYTYFICREYIIAYANGHLIRLAEPQELKPEWGGRWSLSTLPMLPIEFKLVPIANKKPILSALISLMKLPEITGFICATDAGKEGELIYRYIYYYAGVRKPFQRLWISSITDESIRAGLRNLLDGSVKDSLYRAALARAKLDWLIGCNLSRLYSVHYNTDYSVGRVQTATVNMIVERDRKIENFVSSNFYRLYLHNGACWFDLDDDSFASRSAAENIKHGSFANVKSKLYFYFIT